ncbi:chaperone protein dnaJ 20, chloroplastic-like [Cornus florida]|uniref:chaperone protein dnaJ 20, chloroplastic-like n=1 Tax=Cornus florida TaxID=4283 RepID=UPI002897E2AB|nr:chaperone protein dnaJ 20, chloroplastic-like [Cornus florida]
MRQGMISGTGNRAHSHLCTNPHIPTKKPISEPPSHIFFNTHLLKPSISIKNPSGSYRTRTKAAINDHLSMTAQATHSFYELLGISESGTLSEIKQAYKQMARKYHPDVSRPDHMEEYTERFIRVHEAYETLSDLKTRALYDRDLAKGLHLAFSARKRSQYDQRSEKCGEWKDNWEAQLMEMRRRSEHKDSTRNMSWGSRMRRQRNQTFDDEFD